MAQEIVVDVSVFLALLLNEELTPNAERFFARDLVMHVPELCDYEVARVLTKRVRRKELAPQDAGALFAAYHSLDPRYVEGLVYYLEDSFHQAIQMQVSPYDHANLPLSTHLNIPLISADKKLIALSAQSLADY